MMLRAVFSMMLLIAMPVVSATFRSPDQQVVVDLELREGKPEWSVSYQGNAVLAPAALGIETSIPFIGGFNEVGMTETSEDHEWEPVWGRFSQIRDQFNEVIWELKETGEKHRRLDVIVRAYDAGVAVRYVLHGEGSDYLKKDLTTFAFAEDHTCWSANGEQPNIGPIPLSQYNGYQFPLTVQVSESIYASILEAAVNDQAWLYPERAGETAFITAFRSLPRNKKLQEQQAHSKVDFPAKTSWRVLLLAEKPGDLLTGNVLENLNPPCALEDSSWVKPGLAMWDWRAWGGKGKNEFVYNLDMASWRRMIDFASKHGIEYLVLDANWYGHEFNPKSNPMKSRDYIVYQPDPTKPKMADRPAPENWEDPIDIPALIKYGKERKVGVFLYINDVARENFDFEKTLATYQAWGAAGIKYGFMKGWGQEKVLATRNIVELCANYKLHCDFHDGPVPPSGDVRSFPHYLSREFCHAQCDATRSFTPETFCTTVFCNMLAGPLDMCNGFMTLTDLEKQRPKVFKPVYSTVVAEAARVLITFSGLAYLPDTPESYENKADLFEFIASLPMTWDETRILNGEIGKHITTARRSGSSWFIASCCDEKGAELPIRFDFIEDGVEYEAVLYEDTDETHYKTNKESYRTRKLNVKKGDTMIAKLAPGGGHCIRLVPIK